MLKFLKTFYDIIIMNFCKSFKNHLKTTKKPFNLIIFPHHDKSGTSEMEKCSRITLKQGFRVRENHFRLKNEKRA